MKQYFITFVSFFLMSSIPLKSSVDILAPPFPSQVVSISFAPGDFVTEGQNLFTVEAMKMQISMRAPVSGYMGNMNIRLGDEIESCGLVLASIFFNRPNERDLLQDGDEENVQAAIRSLDPVAEIMPEEQLESIINTSFQIPAIPQDEFADSLMEEDPAVVSELAAEEVCADILPVDKLAPALTTVISSLIELPARASIGSVALKSTVSRQIANLHAAIHFCWIIPLSHKQIWSQACTIRTGPNGKNALGIAPHSVFSRTQGIDLDVGGLPHKGHAVNVTDVLEISAVNIVASILIKYALLWVILSWIAQFYIARMSLQVFYRIPVKCQLALNFSLNR